MSLGIFVFAVAGLKDLAHRKGKFSEEGFLFWTREISVLQSVKCYLLQDSPISMTCMGNPASRS